MEVVDACLLLDFYGSLLTLHMRSILELHFAEDMSLAEIAQQENTSRQAVHDTIRRGTSSLMDYENKLGLVARFMEQKQVVSDAISAIEQNQLPLAHEILSNWLKNI